jgi:hypothetical protein
MERNVLLNHAKGMITADQMADATKNRVGEVGVVYSSKDVILAPFLCIHGSARVSGFSLDRHSSFATA